MAWVYLHAWTGILLLSVNEICDLLNWCLLEVLFCIEGLPKFNLFYNKMLPACCNFYWICFLVVCWLCFHVLDHSRSLAGSNWLFNLIDLRRLSGLLCEPILLASNYLFYPIIFWDHWLLSIPPGNMSLLLLVSRSRCLMVSCPMIIHRLCHYCTAEGLPLDWW